MSGRHLTGKLFLRTLPVFLLLLGLMGLLLSLRELDAQTARLESGISEARDFNLRNCQYVLEGDYDPAIKPPQYDDRMAAYYSTYGAVGVFRLYDTEGVELGRSELTSGSFSLPGTGVYDHYLNFDAVLTDDEQLALGRLLRENRQLNQFYGTESGLYDDYLGSGEETSFSMGLRGEVTGVVEHNVVYPQRLVYYYEDGPVTLLDTESPFFDGKRLTTFTFDAVQFSSPLVWAGTDPELTLKLFREAEARLENLVGDGTPSNAWTGSSVGGSGYARSGSVVTYEGLVSVVGVSYRPFLMATHDLVPLYVITLLFTLLLAWFTARVQARAIRRERDFANAAAHELKTPLAVLRAHAECLKEDIEPEKRGEYLAVILDEADRMDGLVGELLTLSRLEAGAAERTGEPVDLAAVVRASFDRLALPAREKKVRIALTLAPCRTAGDGAQLGRLVDNLASNALRHCTPGGEIRVGLAREGDTLRLTVENDGDPIPPEDLPRIWEPFYRGDRARSRETGGAGLGLALVRAIAEGHGGRCTAENRPGTVYFSVTLPALQSTQ